MRVRVRRVFVVGGLLGLLALSVALWLRPARIQRSNVARDIASAKPAASRRLVGAPIAMPFAWLAQRGVAGRRIAGRVLHAGQPVAHAVVRLTTEELHVGEWPLAQVETDDAGHFDLGPRPATRYRVVAQAEGLVAASATADLRALDPRPAPDALTIELLDCDVVVSGTVRDAGGGVIIGAHVRAGTYASEFGTTVSDAEGRYHLCVAAGPIHIEAAADGYGTALQHTRGRREAHMDFALSPESVIAGRVLDPDRSPVEGAVVVAATNGHDPGTVAETGADGRFRLDGLVDGTYLLIARAGDLAAEKSVKVAAGGATDDLVLTLESRAPLAGRVTVGGQPAGGATVLVTSADGPWKLGSAVSQADGRFSMPGLPRGPVKLSVQGHKLVSPDSTLDLAAVHDVELVCERLATVSGRVLREGKPVARAEVHLYQGPMQDQRAIAHDDGAFEIEGVAAGSYEIYAQSIAKGALMARRPLEIGARDIGGLVLELDLAASIAGIVVDATTGAPVAGVAVRFYLDQDHGSDITAADGSFLVTGLAGSGDYYVYLSSSTDENVRYRPPPGQHFPVVHVEGGTTRVTGVRIAIVRGTLEISGQVVRRGKPVVAVSIHASSLAGGTRAQTGPDGTFVLGDLVAGTYRLFVEGPGGMRGTPLAVEAGAKDVRIEIPPGGAIEGTLRGFGIAPHVTVVGAAGEGWYTAEVAGAKFSVADILAGAYEVHAVGTNGAHGSAHVTVATDEIAHVAVQAGATAKVTGVVTDWRTGAPVAGAYCGWTVEGAAMNQQVASDASGAFAFGVPAGPVRVFCFSGYAPSASAHDVSVDLAPNASARVAIELVVGHRDPHALISVALEGGGSAPLRIIWIGGAAGASGLRGGDIVVGIDGRSVVGLDAQAASFLMSIRDANQPARVTVNREGVELSFDVAPEPRPPVSE
jgi:hypothetical protein